MTGKDPKLPSTFARVAFVVPARNAAHTIADTLKSIFAQDWPSDRYEVIVVDNGSTDGTLEIVRQYPVKLLFEPKRGRSAPRNRGMAAVSPDTAFIASVDADVELPTDFLKTLIATMDRPWIVAAQAAVLRIRKEIREEPASEYKLAHYYIPFLDTCAMVFRREALDFVQGFDEDLERHVDMDFSFRLLSSGYAFAWVPRTVVIKHHELSKRQAFYRGLESGKSSFKLGRKWRHIIRVSTFSLIVDRVKNWIMPIIRDYKNHNPAIKVTIPEMIGRIVGHYVFYLTSFRGNRDAFHVVTTIPSIIGPERYLLITPEGCKVYDAPNQRVVTLDRKDTESLIAHLDGKETSESRALIYRLYEG